MSRNFTENELRNWILSLNRDNVRSLEQALKSIRNDEIEGKLDENNTKNTEDESMDNKEIDDFENFKLQFSNDALVKVEPINESTNIPNDCNNDDLSPTRTNSPISSSFSNYSRSKIGKTYENGRRNLKDEEVSEEEANRRAKRRERNRLAAAKCRKRRQDKIETLQEKVNRLRGDVEQLTGIVKQNDVERTKLNDIINSHTCVMKQAGHEQSGHTKTIGTTTKRPATQKIHSQLTAKRPNSLPILDTAAASLSSISANNDNKVTNNPASSINRSKGSNGKNNNSVVICSLSPQLVNLSPLFTPQTMKLLLDSFSSSSNNNSNGNHNNTSDNFSSSSHTQTPSSANSHSSFQASLNSLLAGSNNTPNNTPGIQEANNQNLSLQSLVNISSSLALSATPPSSSSSSSSSISNNHNNSNLASKNNNAADYNNNITNDSDAHMSKLTKPNDNLISSPTMFNKSLLNFFSNTSITNNNSQDNKHKPNFSTTNCISDDKNGVIPLIMNNGNLNHKLMSVLSLDNANNISHNTTNKNSNHTTISNNTILLNNLTQLLASLPATTSSSSTLSSSSAVAGSSSASSSLLSSNLKMLSEVTNCINNNNNSNNNNSNNSNNNNNNNIIVKNDF